MSMRLDETWVDRLRRLADGPASGRGFSFVAGDEVVRLDYAHLERRARAVSTGLLQLAVPGDRAILLTDQSPAFVEGFLGCAFAGMPAVPAFPLVGGPADARAASMIRDAAPAVAITNRADRAAMQERLSAFVDPASLRWLALDEVADHLADDWRDPVLAGDSLLLLQYTSGSTADPKGVMVTHANASHNQAAIARGMGLDESMRIIGWLPLHHSAGLVALMLQPLFLGAECEILAPEAFLRDPRVWLERISLSREAVTSGGPNFAYDLCAQRVGPERRGGLDLGRWAVAFTGSEPVRAATLRRFGSAFAECGFRPSAFTPCYGIAEATSVVTSAPGGRGPAVRSFLASDLLRHRATPAPAGSADARELVGNGPAWGGQEVLVVDPETNRPLPDGTAGEVWVRGPAVAPGYWRRPEATAQSYGGRLSDDRTDEAGPFLRTGDLGFWHEGELYIAGRIKDVIIIRGANHSPLDIEQTAEGSDPRIIPGATAAFAIEAGGEERLAIALEVADGIEGDALAEVADAVRLAVAGRHALTAECVTLLPRGSLPRTPTGKIPRQVIRRRFLAGDLPTLRESRLVEAGECEIDETAEAETGRAVPLLEMVRSLATRVLRRATGRVDDDRPLNIQGLDSLRSVELAWRLQERWSVVVSPAELLGRMTPSDLAGRIEGLLRDGPDATPPGEDLGMDRDAVFDVIDGPRTSDRPASPPGAIFLTGATGFVGAFLLRSLLERTGASIRCLVRSASPSEAMARVLANAAAHEVDLGDHRDRIIPVTGDLGRPGLDLNPADREAIVADVDAIFHNGAHVNFLQPYDALRASNVEGTREVLRLAASGRPKAVHVISSIAVVPFRARAGCPLVLEDDPLEDGRFLASGYAQTKWVADALARDAARRGFPVKVYRLGVVTGDSRSGACNLRDFMPNLLRSCVELGIAPEDVPLPVDMTPVDVAAASIVALATDSDPGASIFHVVNPAPVPFRAISREIRRLGYPLRELPFGAWLDEVNRSCRQDPSAALLPYLPTLEELRLPAPGPRFDCTNTTRGLRGTGITFPSIDAALIGTYWDYFLKLNFMPPPNAQNPAIDARDASPAEVVLS